jgi:hypothetical protein
MHGSAGDKTSRLKLYLSNEVVERNMIARVILLTNARW